MSTTYLNSAANKEYSAEAFKYIGDQNSATLGYIIDQVSTVIGISAGAIAGAMAEENTAYGNGDWVLDQFVDYLTHDQLKEDYEFVDGDANPDLLDKLVHRTLIDAGPANIKVYTAIRLVNKYAIVYPELQLDAYLEDYSVLVDDLLNKDSSLSATIYGLYLKEAEDWFKNNIEGIYAGKWDSLPQEFRDALLVTYTNLGKKGMEDAKEDLYKSKGLPYEPQPGLTVSGGMNHLLNAKEIGQKIGIEGYGDDVVGVSSMASKALLAGDAGIAARYALYRLRYVAIDGLNYGTVNVDGKLDLYDQATGKGSMTAQYIDDRSELLALWITKEITESIPNGPELIEYHDLATGETWFVNSVSSGPARQFIFGSDSGDSIEGLGNKDHLYGGAGDDTLEGKGGNDYLEGGTGNDTYIYATGDGFDTIMDTDGLGSIQFDGTTLTGGKEIADGLYQSDDKAYTYKLVDNGSSTDLVINDSILIKNFDSGDLGINLDEPAEYVSPATTTEIEGDHEVLLFWETQKLWSDIEKQWVFVTDWFAHIDENGNVVADYGTNVPKDDVLYGSDGNDHIQGFLGADVLWGTGNIVDGVCVADGDDLIEGGEGNDLLCGFNGDDTLFANCLQNIDYVIDSDTRPVGTNHNWLSGVSGNDTLYGYDGADILCGGEDDDIVFGGAGDDYILGDSDQMWRSNTPGTQWVDYYFDVDGNWINYPSSLPLETMGVLNPVGSGDDTLMGGAGDDQIWGQAGDDIIFGGVGDDSLSGDILFSSGYLPAQYHGNDIIDGGAGDDGIMGEGGDDILFGGDGNDLIHGDAHSVYREDGSLLLPAEFHGGDALYGGNGEDTLIGGSGDDDLFGGDDADVLFGDDNTTGLTYDTHGDDYLDGGEGDDLLVGNGGNDSLYGGAGDDELQGDDNNVDSQHHGDDILDGGVGVDTLWGMGGSDTLFGGEGDDQLYGDDNDIASVYHGDDFLDGGAGNDMLAGYGGNDVLWGGTGNDSLWGGDGDDVLIGESGNDYLSGGEGQDSYYFSTGDGSDTITDGTVGAINITGNITKYQQNGSSSVISYGNGDRITLQYGSVTGVQDILVNGESVNIFDYLNSDNSSPILGTAGNDAIDTSNIGTATSVNAADGNDTILLSEYGVFNIEGGAGDDQYVITPAGQKINISFGSSDVGTDSIHIKGDFTHDQLYATKDGSSLTLYVSDRPDAELVFSDSTKIVLTNYFTNLPTFGSISFDNGETISLASLIQDIKVLGDNTGNTIYGSSEDDVFFAKKGNDRIYGNGGNDTYIYRAGDGNDTIYIQGSNDDVNTLQLRNINPADVLLRRRYNNDLLVRIADGEEIYINNHFNYTGGYALDDITFEDGITWNSAYIDAAVLLPTEGDDYLVGDDSNNHLYGGDGSDWIGGYGGDDTLEGEKGDDSLKGGLGNDTLLGGDGNDSIRGEEGNDILKGGKDNDYLSGGYGDDSLEGGEGDDRLIGGAGSDAYLYGAGDGVDVIDNNDPDTASYDCIRFDDSIDPSDIIVRREYSHLVLYWQTNKILTVQNHFASEDYAIDEIVFEDGTVYTQSDINELILPPTVVGDILYGTDGDDVMVGLEGNDILYGRAGNDVISGDADDDQLYGEEGDDLLYGGTGDDTLYGGDGGDSLYGETEDDYLYAGDGDDFLYGGTGDDRIYGEDGDDYLFCGTGDDRLVGGNGSDTYEYHLGDGHDTIYSNGDGVQDQIIFGPGITPDMLFIRRYWGTLSIYINSDLCLTIRNTYNNDTSAIIKGITFDDGTQWDLSDITLATLESTDLDDVLFGYDQSDIANGLYGYDELVTFSGDDDLTGGLGDDTLRGGTGNDTYHFSLWDGVDTIIDIDSDADSTDSLVFDGSVDPDDIWAQRTGGNLIFTNKISGDRIVIKNYYSWNSWDRAYNQSAKQVQFDDGTVWTDGDLRTFCSMASDSDNYMLGSDGDDVLSGLGGDDLISGGGGDDDLSGGRGNDSLSGGEGDDVLNGGRGNDELGGGNGTNTYIYQHGDGFDVISGSSSDGLDILELTDINPDDVWMHYNIGYLGTPILSMKDGSGSIVLGRGGYGDFSTRCYIDAIHFGDGTQWDVADMEAALVPSTPFDDLVRGTDVDDDLNGMAGNDLLEGGDGDDTYHFSRGDGMDVISDSGGFNTISFSADITPDDVVIWRNIPYWDSTPSYYSLTIRVKGSGQQIDISNFYHYSKTATYEVVFTSSPGNTLSYEALQARSDFSLDLYYQSLDLDLSQMPLGITSNWDTVTSDVGIFPTTGDDTLFFNMGGIWAGEGDDVLVAAKKPSTVPTYYQSYHEIDGGLGDDVVYGGGDDSFIFGGPASTYYDYLSSNYYGNYSSYGGIPYPEGFDVNNTPIDGDDILYAEGGDDYLQGGVGNDLLSGGHGNDIMSGGDGDDTYLFNLGDGQDRITFVEEDPFVVVDLSTYQERADYTNDFDRVLFGAHIDPNDVIVTREGVHLKLTINHSLDSITIERFFSADLTLQHGIKEIEFQDGTIWNLNDIYDHAFIPTDVIIHETALAEDALDANLGGDDGSNTLIGNSSDNILTGLQGDDGLYGGTGSDQLFGGAGNDVLSGQSGDDYLVGGTGNDYLIGGNQNDTYFFSSGFGKDIIDNYDDTQNGDSALGNFSTDTIVFDADIDSSGVRLYRLDDDLVIINRSDWLTVKNHFLGIGLGFNQRYAIDAISFSDGTTWNADDIESLLQEGPIIQPPEVNIPISDQTTDEDVLFTFQIPEGTFIDPDSDDALSLTADLADGSSLPDWLVFDADTGVFSGTPSNDDVGDLSIRVVATDLDGASAETTFNLNVANVNDAPELKNELPDVEAVEGDSFSYVIPTDTFQDIDAGDSLTYTATMANGDSLPAWLTFDSGTMSLSSELPMDAAGEYDIAIQATDSSGASISDTFHLSVTNLVQEAAWWNWFDGTSMNDLIIGSGNSEWLYGYDGNDQLIAGGGNDLLNGGAGNDMLDAGTGNDILDGRSGDDILDGGDGRDELWGGRGNDQLQGGAGQDSLYGGSGNDVLVGDNGNQQPQVAVDWYGPFDWFGHNPFGDRSSDDTLWGGDGNDRLQGGAGNDTLNGGSGDDVLEGGTGNDTISGGRGSDTYKFALLDGQDIINNYAARADDLDVLSFDGIASSDLLFSRQWNNLVIDVVGTNDRVTVQNWYWGKNFQLDAIETSDLVLENDQVNQLVNAMAVFDVPIGFGTVVPQEVKDQFSPVLAYSWQ